MIEDVFFVLFAALVGGLVGVMIHEFSHFIVLRLTRPDVRFRIHRDGRVLYPAVEFPRRSESVSWATRVAAVAPLITGICLGVPLVIAAATVSKTMLAMAIGAVVWTSKLSPQDRKLALGERAS